MLSYLVESPQRLLGLDLRDSAATPLRPSSYSHSGRRFYSYILQMPSLSSALTLETLPPAQGIRIPQDHHTGRKSRPVPVRGRTCLPGRAHIVLSTCQATLQRIGAGRMHVTILYQNCSSLKPNPLLRTLK